MRSLYLKPGEYYLGDRPIRITTVLGSCVAVSLYHRPSRLACICHVLAPACKPEVHCQDKCTQAYRYVNCMIPAMVRSFTTRGIASKEIETKLFGGASVIGEPCRSGDEESIGALNIAAARKAIDHLGLVIKIEDVGGCVGRKIVFDTSTGDILLKRLRRPF